MVREGNQYGLKLKGKDVRQEAYAAYCDWLSQGKSWKTFTFKKGDLWCTGRTIRSYIKENPEEFPSYKQEFAFAQGYAMWEEEIAKSAKGINEKASTASLQMLMRNKYDWDMKDSKSEEQEEKSRVPLDKYSDAIRDARQEDGIIDPLVP